MNGTKKRLPVTLLALSVCFLSITNPLHAKKRNRNDSKTSDAFIVGAVTAAFAAGAVALGSWLFSQSDEDIINNAQQAVDSVYDDYGPVIAYLECNWYGSMMHNGSFVKNLTEQQLDTLGAMIGHPGITIDAATRSARQLYDRVRKSHGRLTKRLHKIELNSYAGQKMAELEQDVYEAMKKVQRVVECLTTHAHYFALRAIDQKVRTTYQKELALVDSCCSSACMLDHQLRGLIFAYGNKVSAQYPYLSFVSAVTNDKRSLDAAICACDLYYETTLKSAKLLSNQLEIIKNAAMSDPLYAKALSDRERDRLEQERIALQRELQKQQEKIQAQQAMLAAQQAAMLYEMSKPKPMIVYEPIAPYSWNVCHHEPDVVVLEHPGVEYVYDVEYDVEIVEED